ncbi:DUF7013 family protein [Lactobacillus delbrueckii]|uniref:DUF7013 family protein n=1 Tax=Lactobacillus delbrueckii TaxID=1584 RepID=UPI0037C6C5B1
MPTINGRACVVNGSPVDKVYSDGKQVYGRNFLKNTGNLSATSTTNWWNVLFDYSNLCNSTMKSLSYVSAMAFSFNMYVPLSAPVGDLFSIQIKGQSSQAQNIFIDTYNTIFDYANYFIKQNDLGKTIRVSYLLHFEKKYQSFDNALADTARITIRQNSNLPGFVISKIKLEIGTVSTPWTSAPEDVGAVVKSA